MLPDRVSNPGPLTYESGALPIALSGQAQYIGIRIYVTILNMGILSSFTAIFYIYIFGVFTEKPL